MSREANDQNTFDWDAVSKMQVPLYHRAESAYSIAWQYL